jgi:hypothetical protein
VIERGKRQTDRQTNKRGRERTKMGEREKNEEERKIMRMRKKQK